MSSSDRRPWHRSTETVHQTQYTYVVDAVGRYGRLKLRDLTPLKPGYRICSVGAAASVPHSAAVSDQTGPSADIVSTGGTVGSDVIPVCPK